MRRLEGKRCLLTGGTRGLGRALALAFARAGARVAFTFAEDETAAAALLAELKGIGGEPDAFRGAVSDVEHAQETVNRLVEDWGGVDILVNHAGPTENLPVALVEESDWDQVMNTNVKGAYLFSRAVLGTMIRSQDGHILNVASFASERTVDAPIHYAAAQSALLGLTEALAREVGRHNVRVNLVAPGLLDVGLSEASPETEIQDYVSRCPMRRVGTAEELADFATFIVSAENTFMTGARIAFDGGI